MGEKFAENKIVCFINPSDGYKFMMITWADLIGVVSGMNEKGLTVTINAARSAIPRQAATPVTILAREILQYASTIQEAYEISKKRKLFVSESIMIGSAIDHRTTIIEKSRELWPC
jgi:predicted choloylglycine hydrolase